jgi:hypothetical protein
MVSDKIGDASFINNFIIKSRRWIESFGGDEAEGATKTVMTTCTEQVNRDPTNLKQINTLMIRLAFEN